MKKDILKEHPAKSILIAIGVTAFLLISLYFLADTVILDNWIEISGIVAGLFSLRFPKEMHYYLTFDSEIPFDKKKVWQYRVGGILLILMSIGFLIFL
mgnify:CR=1 FL=1